MAIHIIDEANRCLNCKKPRCMEGCPVHTPIPHIIQMFKEHKVMDAGAELFQNNPMSVICSIVCDHEQQCAGHCVLGKKGNPVHFSSIENYISDTYLDRMKLQIPEEKKKTVAVTFEAFSAVLMVYSVTERWKALSQVTFPLSACAVTLSRYAPFVSTAIR